MEQGRYEIHLANILSPGLEIMERAVLEIAIGFLCPLKPCFSKGASLKKVPQEGRHV